MKKGNTNEIKEFNLNRDLGPIKFATTLRPSTQLISYDYLYIVVDLSRYAREIEFDFVREKFLRTSKPTVKACHYESVLQGVTVDSNGKIIHKYKNAVLTSEESVEINRLRLQELNSQYSNANKIARINYPSCKPFYDYIPNVEGISFIYIDKAQLVIKVSGKLVSSDGNLGLINRDNINLALDRIKATELVTFDNEAFINRAFIYGCHPCVDIITDDVNSLYRSFSSYLPVRTDKYAVIAYKSGFEVIQRGKKGEYALCIYNKGPEVNAHTTKRYKEIIGSNGIRTAQSTVRIELRLFKWKAIREFLLNNEEIRESQSTMTVPIDSTETNELIKNGSITLRQALASTQQPIRRMLSLLDITDEKLIEARGTAISNASSINEDKSLGHAEFLKMIGLVTILEKNDYDFIKARSYIESETLNPLPTSFMSGMRGILQRYIACYKPTTIQILEALLAVLPY